MHCSNAHLLLACFTAAILAQVDAAAGSGPAAQRIVAQSTLEALPAPLHDYFAPFTDGVIERALEPDAVWRQEPRYAVRGTWHYLELDVAADDRSVEACLRAARAFPVRAADARKLFRDHDIKHGGELIWRLDEEVAKLAEALAHGNRPEAIQYAGYVIHFASDAADPFACTRDRRGEAVGNAIFATASMGDALYAHQDVAQRVGWELVRRNAQRYREGVAPSEQRFELNIDASSVALETMIEAYGSLAALCTADRETLAGMQVSDAPAFTARADEYYPLLAQRCDAHVVAMLQRGTRLATTLIVSAWNRAGSPTAAALVKSPQQAQPAEATSNGVAVAQKGEKAGADKPASPATASKPAAGNAKNGKADQKSTGEKPSKSSLAGADGFVASQSGKVYHLPSCAHAARINSDNIVRFKTRAEAEASGRRPCKTCKPDATSADR
jgi:hypothetical protein